MSYIINNSRGQVVAVIPDGTINTSATSLALVGRAVNGYGESENENYVFLLENFAKSTPPLQPILGQLWYNSDNDELNAYNTGNAWIALASQDYVQAQKISPVFTGVPRAPTAPLATANTQIATTAFVYAVTGNLGLGTMSVQNANSVAITGGTITGITDLAVADGGTGASNPADARDNLGLGTIATQNANSVAISGGAIVGITDLAVADGGTGASTPAQARTNLGIGTLGTQNANAVAITGGTITGIAPLPIVSGGTSATTAQDAVTNLGAVPTTRSIIAGDGLTGTGPLSADVTLSIAGNSNGFGRRYVSTSTPVGGVDGDIWYQI